MIAILEQYQQKDGCVVIPKVLGSLMGGVERLG
jgi:seryl-tRNA synthetase